MKVGLIGAGSMGQAHINGWKQTNADVIGIASHNKAKADNLAQQVGARIYDDYTQLLRDVDVVDICTPTNLHHDMVMQAAAAHVHTFCEKPIALTVADGIEMLGGFDANVRFFIGMVLHFFPEYRAMMQSVDSGSVGTPKVIRMTRASYRPQRDADDWFMDESKSGGMMLDLMIHDFEMSRWLAQGDVVRVFAKSIRSQNPDVLADHALAILRFDNGAMAHIEGSWAYPLPMFSVRAEVAGDNGLIEWESDKSMPLHAHYHQTSTTNGDVALPGSPLIEDPWVTEVKHFYHALMSGDPFAVSPLDALKGLQIALAAKQSAQTNTPITLEKLEVI